MPLTRKMLKAMGIEEEKIDQIIEAHTDVTDALKADRDKYKADADKLPSVQKELNDLKEENEKREDDPYKEKYEKEHQAFEDYKKGIEAEETKQKKVAAYKALLKEAGVSEKRIDAIIKVTPMDDVKLDKDGKVKDSETAIENVKKEWSEFIVKTTDEGAGTENPPSGAGAGGTKTLSRAAQVVQARNERLYGVSTKGDNEK